jgi:hypothetical protein
MLDHDAAAESYGQVESRPARPPACHLADQLVGLRIGW